MKQLRSDTSPCSASVVARTAAAPPRKQVGAGEDYKLSSLNEKNMSKDNNMEILVSGFLKNQCKSTLLPSRRSTGSSKKSSTVLKILTHISHLRGSLAGNRPKSPKTPLSSMLEEALCSPECHDQEREKILLEIERYINTL